jgi:murein DD-endopeptidase MepM/ murein hydrolase activator NlpD
MKPRRRRWLREDTVAPWVTVAVILALWWSAAWLLNATPDTEHAPYESVVADARPASNDRNSPDARDAQARRAPGASSAPSALAPSSPSALAPGAPSAPSDALPASVSSGGDHVIPVAGIDPRTLTSTFNAERGGNRRHEAMDIMAPRGTPVLASVTGRVVKLFTSAAGGLTIYQFDEDEEYCYYYAHLDSYAPDLTEGQVVARGQIIGFVGTTGNAPPGAPHLHFAIHRLGPDKRWWEGEPLDPMTFLR